ncbi:MAG: hypothetical protein RBR86_03420 [Pseudobdellovibrionaceae bacterium]|jgi:5-carboxymethyl-2-hydroxymuconate isomerase|nr:hypothetical protein [Pseudobdellovibrionaceae bacterium]
MPHIIAELNATLLPAASEQDLLKALHLELAKEPSVALDRIKTRSVHLPHVIVGDDTKEDRMIHIVVKLLKGRSVETRKTIGLALQKTTQDFLARKNIGGCHVTVEMIELDPETYAA